MHWDVYRRELEEAVPTAAVGTSKLSDRTRTIGLYVPYSTSAPAHDTMKMCVGGVEVHLHALLISTLQLGD
jgi:hypothetical protein